MTATLTAAAPRTVSWAVWGSTATVVTEHPEGLAAARTAVTRLLAAVDAAASRFRPDSELAAVNAGAGSWVPASPLFCALLAAALDAAEDTEGAVDPTLGRALRGTGYDRDITLAGTGPPVQVRYHGPRWQEVELDTDRVRIPRGTELDLGATAKAWAADHAATRAYAAAGGPVLVNLGGDLAVAGCPDHGPFPVVVAEDHREVAGPVVYVGDGGLATSSTTVRRWRQAGVDRHHLIDPVTGQPTAGPWRTVTTAAATCLAANTASTAAVVLGARALGWLCGTGLPARLVGADGRVCTVNGWPPEPRRAG